LLLICLSGNGLAVIAIQKRNVMGRGRRKSGRTDGGIPEGSGGRIRASSAVGCVENVNCGVWLYLHAVD